MMYGWWDGSTAPWYGMISGPIVMIVFIAVTALLIAWAMRRAGLGWQPSVPQKSALDILKDRFARGEIDRTEYEERKKLLSGT